jgi:hypothetical protein
MNLIELCDEMKTYLDNHDAKKAIDIVFGRYRSGLNGFDPNQKDTFRFLWLLESAVEAEAKHEFMMMRRRIALASVVTYNAHPGTPQFTGVNPHQFAFQLALRIREPSLISQGNLGVCGANAAIIHFAKTDPQSYAKLGIDLMINGKGKFGQKQIEPDHTIKSRVKTLRLAAADYVVLASVRGSATFLQNILYESKRGIKEGQSVESLCKALRDSGYTDVEQHADLSYSKREKSLEDAATAVKNGKLVIISINGEIVNVMRGDKRKEFSQAHMKKDDIAYDQAIRKSGSGRTTPEHKKETSNHWVLVSKLVLSPPDIDIKLYSWGESVRRTIPVDRFLDYYDGFICANLGGEERSAPKPTR